MQVGNCALVSTKKEKCRMCYTCIRECPAKAIRVTESQASVDMERCIGCGNCVRVCTQAAKTVFDSIPQVELLLQNHEKTYVMLAPSFPAEFADLEPNRIVGALESLGFAGVFEVAFGADLVASEYARILKQTSARYIGSTCPSVVAFVQKYFPSLVSHLMPVVSPMIATSRVIKHLKGANVKVVFVGPCIAKKGEAACSEVGGEIDAVLTFAELRSLFASKHVAVNDAPLSRFLAPRGNLGGLFSVTRGLLQAANLKEDIVDGSIIAAEGNPHFVTALQEFEKGGESIRLLELLSCNGCIGGVGFSNDEPHLVRRHRISEYVKHRCKNSISEESEISTFLPLGFSRVFLEHDKRLLEPSEKELCKILKTMEKLSSEDELNCGACGYSTCRQCATAIFRGLAEKEMCLPYTIEHLRNTVKQLENSNQDLTLVKEALTQSEKLASMGQMAAGIAHEVNNPLGIVLLYANLLLESSENNPEKSSDLEIIIEQTERCKKIVMGLLNFARQNKVFRQKTDVFELCQKVVKENNIDPKIGISINYFGKDELRSLELDPDQISQVLTNLIDNACTAMEHGGKLNINIDASISSTTFTVQDTGSGISKENITKIFDPFFSTKAVGKGTGLGLAVVHGIVKMHQGKILAESNSNKANGPTGSKFTVIIPRIEP